MKKPDAIINGNCYDFKTVENPIVKAVQPLKDKAIARAEKNAKESIKEVAADLKANGWDLNKCAPYPRNCKNEMEFQGLLYRYYKYNDLTTWVRATYGMNEPKIVRMDEQKAEKYIEKMKKAAATQFDAYVTKLTIKIGATEKAVLEGNHIWDYSLLHVVLPSGEKQTWKTHEINNRSVYGLWFNQWPTRKLKTFIGSKFI